jgi:hypothetical protein
MRMGTKMIGVHRPIRLYGTSKMRHRRSLDAYATYSELLGFDDCRTRSAEWVAHNRAGLKTELV